MPKVAYGAEALEFDLEPGDTLTEREPADQAVWRPEVFRQVLETAGFDEFINAGRPLVVVNDAFRPTPTGRVLSQIKSWYPQFAADFIIACGNHPAPDETEIASIFEGYSVDADSKVYIHDSGERESMLPAGAVDGHEILINRHLFDYPAIIIIGSVEPHYFAGFTGGRKSLIPGLADIDTNRRNHALAVSPEAAPLRLAGNPVAEHLDRLVAAVNLPSLMSIQIVAGRGQKIIDCFCGSLRTSFEEAVAVSGSVYAFKPEQRFDLVLAEMRAPLDRNLYQLQKAIENTAPVVRDGGTLVAVSPCSEGIGNDEFYQLAARLKNEDMVLSHAEADHPPMGIHKLSRIVGLSRRIAVKALTGLKHEIVRQVFLTPAVSIEAEMQKLKQGETKQINILLVRDAGLLAAKVD